jgi:dTDP-glucose 4,6-dehydratase
MNIYNINNSKIFITGGAGFIATKLASILADDNQIILYDNLHNNAYANTPLSEHPNVKLIKGDILDLDSLKKAMAPDVNYVIHCAAIAGVSTVIENPILTLNVNINGTFNVFDVAKDLKSLKRIIDFSTSEVFGQLAYDVDESLINPAVTIGEARWTYAISKLAGEFIAHSYHIQKDLPTVTVRPFNIYGPNQVGVGAIHCFLTRAIKDEPLMVHNDGAQIRSWCFVDDFVHGVLLMLKNEKAIGKSYNIGNPRSTLTVLNLVNLIVHLSQSRSMIEFKKINYEDVKVRIPNITAARTDLGFEPIVELEEGLKCAISWYKRKAEALAE